MINYGQTFYLISLAAVGTHKNKIDLIVISIYFLFNPNFLRWRNIQFKVLKEKSLHHFLSKKTHFVKWKRSWFDLKKSCFGFLALNVAILILINVRKGSNITVRIWGKSFKILQSMKMNFKSVIKKCFLK